MKKTILITGATDGIGLLAAKKLFAQGHQLLIHGRNQAKLEQVSEQLGGLNTYLADFSDMDSVVKMAKAVLSDYERLDVLINNAGIHMDNILLRMKNEEWSKVMDVNLNGPFHLTKTVLKDMVKNKCGRIINISSISGTGGNKGQGNYAASKGGLLALTKSLAKEVGRRNITVNCIAPGLIETDMTSHLSETVKKGYLDRIPLKRLGKPKDIGQMILFLCSNEASYITGQTFYIDGGMSLN